MKLSYISLIIICCCQITILGCKKPVSRKNEIIKVEVATGWCFGPCQLTALSIDSSLELKYFGGRLLPGRWRKTLQGYYKGRVSRLFWDSLNMKLEDIKYKKLDTNRQWVMDSQILEVIIYYRNGVKHIKTSEGSFPDSIEKVFLWIDSSYKATKLQHIKGPIQFKTVAQSKYW
jgi:hypothetical protein